MSLPSIALHRFGLGARPDEAIPDDPRRWLADQLDRFEPRPAVLGATPGTLDTAAMLMDYYQQQQELRREQAQADAYAKIVAAQTGLTNQPLAILPASPQPGAPAMGLPTRQQLRRDAGQALRERYGAAVRARFDAALTTPAPFAERLVHFWANHFAVSNDKIELTGLAGPFEFEAIRPNLMGKFGDLLGAVERHPAMLLYLDQAQSIGPTSQLGTRLSGGGRRKVGLNENLAREVMELHTLGVRTGYSQADVTEFARALTGWTVTGIGRGPGAKLVDGGAPGRFIFAAALHEPGDRAIMGKSYPAAGEEQGQAVLSDLAVHPATAKHLATKLARHFIADNPPPAAVRRIQTAFLRSGGDLPTVYRAIIASPEAWAAKPVKFRNPWEWAVAAHRALGARQSPGNIVGLLDQLGQPTWKPGQPSGWDDVAASWAGPDAVMRRVEAAARFAGRSNGVDARSLAPKLFPAALTSGTAQAVARAEDGGEALSLLLVAPEMMRR